MMAIDPPNLEPPYDPVYDDLEVWKVKIEWDSDEYDVRYIPDIGYESHEMLSDFKRDFYRQVMRYVGYASPWKEQEFVYSKLSKEEFMKELLSENKTDTFALVSALPSYHAEEPYRTRYHKSKIVEWLKDNRERWLKIDVMDFWKIPYDKQDEIRSFIEEMRVTKYLED